MDTMTYYQDHEENEELHVDEDEEYQENLFLQQHYGRPRLGGLGLVHDDDSSEDDDVVYRNHHRRAGLLHSSYHHHDGDDEDEGETDDVEVDEDEYKEMDMDHHNIQLLSGSLSVRSPFLDAIREEEGEEPVFTKPSSYPSLGTGRYLQRLSSGGGSLGDAFGGWGSRSSLGMALADKQLQSHNQQQQQQQQQQVPDQQQTNFNNTNQSDGGKPRGPRPPLLLGRPRSNTTTTTPTTTTATTNTSLPSSLTRITAGFNVPGTAAAADDDVQETVVDKSVLRETQMSPENPIQDLEVKRVLEGAAAMASAAAAAAVSAPDGAQSADSTPLPSSVHVNSNTVPLSTAGKTIATFEDADPTASFGQDTQKSIDDFFGMVKSDLDKRIQEAIQEVEQKFLHRVQKLEEHTAALAGAPAENSLDLTGSVPKAGSLMESLSRPLPLDQTPGGSLALRKEILSHVTEKVGDLDMRVNQMEVLVSYKLVDIESKVKDLHGAHNSIAQKVHQVAKSHKSNMQGLRAGDGVGEGTIKAEEARISNAMQPYRDIDAEGHGAEAYLEPIEGEDDVEGIVSIRGTRGRAANGETTTELVDASPSIIELRHELQALGMRYQELNDGLLTDLMGQMRDAKLILFQTVDEVDGRISKRVDRIEAEMHSKLLSEIEGRVQERVRAMEQTSVRLEKCFDRMEGRLGALETVLASRRPRPESMYQLLQQQLQQQQQQDEENGILPHAGTFSGFSSNPSFGYRSITSMLFSEADSKPTESASAQYVRPRRRTLAENGIYIDDSQPATTPQETGYSPSRQTLMANPLEGFVSIAPARPAWSPTHGVSTTALSHLSGSSSLPTVASPLERGTVIGSRMGTIHAEYIPKTTYVPSTPTKDKFQNSVPTTPTKERFQNSFSSSSAAIAATAAAEQAPVDQASRLRRVSLSSFDASSLSALKPVRATAATATSPTAIVTAATATATATTTLATASNQRSYSSSFSGGNGLSSSRSSSSSLLTARLNSAGDSDGKLSNGPSSSLLLAAKLNNTGSSSSSSSSISGSASGSTRIMQRAMTFDTLHSAATATAMAAAGATSTITKTVKTPVQGPSSYREILHFWKTGSSGSNTSSQSAAV